MIPQPQLTGSKGVSICSSPNYEQPGAKVVVLTTKPRSITTTKNTAKRILGPPRPSTSLGLTPTTGRHHTGSAPIAVRNSKIGHSTTSITSESRQSSYADRKYPNASSSQNSHFGRSHSAKTSILSIPIECNNNNSRRPCINTVSVPKTATHRQENNPSKNVSPPYASEGCDRCLTTPEKGIIVIFIFSFSFFFLFKNHIYEIYRFAHSFFLFPNSSINETKINEIKQCRSL